MTTVTILPVSIADGATTYHARSGDKQSVGATAGAALDALTAQLQGTGSSTVVILQKMQPDEFFTASQQQRLGDLMDEWRKQRDSGHALPDQRQQALEALVEAELLATIERANKLLDDFTQ